MRVAITGEKGFLGIHLTSYFKHILKYEVIELGRDYLEELSKKKQIDWLILGAFIHRHPEKNKVLDLNRNLTQNTLKVLEKSNFNGNIAFLSSIQEGNGSPYGQAKKEAREVFANYCLKTNSKFIAFKLPNIFGEYAKPKHTSFIATFCYNLNNDISIDYNKNKVSLCYVHDAIKIIAKFEQINFPITETTVETVYFILKDTKNNIKQGILPSFKTKLELDLYNTYLRYIHYRL